MTPLLKTHHILRFMFYNNMTSKINAKLHDFATETQRPGQYYFFRLVNKKSIKYPGIGKSVSFKIVGQRRGVHIVRATEHRGRFGTWTPSTDSHDLRTTILGWTIGICK